MLRCRGEFTFEKAPGTKRILVFGDSFTESDCVSDGERFTDLLREALGAKICNFGISGTGADQQFLIHREIGSLHAHDLVPIGTHPARSGAQAVRQADLPPAAVPEYDDHDGAAWQSCFS